MDSYAFIINPAAGKGAGRKVVTSLKEWLSRVKLDHELSLTEGPGHATEIAQNSKAHVVVAVGGDGTVNEVANGLIGTGKTMGIMPTGSGNDLVRSIGISRNLERAFQTLLNGTRRVIDTGTVECPPAIANHPGNSKARHFVNGVGVGFDAAVAERTRHIKYVSGTPLYLIALFQTLWRYKSPQFTVQIDSSTTSSKKFLIAIGNGKCVGGGFYLTPDAVIDDGFLDVCFVDDLPIFSIIGLIPQIMRAKHRAARGITLLRARSISISSGTDFFVHADGEIVGNNVQSVRVAIDKESLRVITD
jgi:diacylglycerol kinase (ATP)